MNAWLAPEIARWFSFLSLLSILAVLAPVAQQGKYKTLVTAVYAAAVAVGLGFLAVTGVALFTQQPGYVVFPLLLVGVVVSIVFGATFPVMRRAYRDAEDRKIAARNL